MPLTQSQPGGAWDSYTSTGVDITEFRAMGKRSQETIHALSLSQEEKAYQASIGVGPVADAVAPSSLAPEGSMVDVPQGADLVDVIEITDSAQTETTTPKGDTGFSGPQILIYAGTAAYLAYIVTR